MISGFNVVQIFYGAPGRRFLSLCTAPLLTAYDVKKFADPVTDLEELNKPLPKDDDRHYLFIKAQKSDESPVFYRNYLVDKFVRVCMKSGNKEKVRLGVYLALEEVKRRQYKRWLEVDEEEKKAIELDPFAIAERAIMNCRPRMKLCVAVRGGISYQVPSPVSEEESIFRAMKTIREVCRTKAKRGAIHFEEILAVEFLAASKNEGASVQAKQELHKLCEANRAFAHYRSS
ncbi:unnamed protein product [Enterobius vermicularis]|uniref:Small ribosomal subunit protein uS7m n=1 Tax=Enterobius vermicularis TaxID=51028 RepID=A0A0N4VNA7_ENTVE|nr:unnamed protein product [Enterobius vermicularis]